LTTSLCSSSPNSAAEKSSDWSPESPASTTPLQPPQLRPLLLSWLFLILHGVHITLLPGRWKMPKCLRETWHRWHSKTLYVAQMQSSTWWRSIWTKPWYQGHLQTGWFSLVAFTLDP
jgi:hypothetical protein